MGKRKTQPCFWCQVSMTAPMTSPKHGAIRTRSLRPYDRTKDHIIPQSQIGHYAGVITTRMRLLNKVNSCNRCNNLRGDIDPIIWATQHRPESTRRLAALLIDMGFPKELVLEAFTSNNPLFTLESLT